MSRLALVAFVTLFASGLVVGCSGSSGSTAGDDIADSAVAEVASTPDTTKEVAISTDTTPDDTIPADTVSLDASPPDTVADTAPTPDTEVVDALDGAGEIADEIVTYPCEGSPTPYDLAMVADDTFDLGPYLMYTTPTSVVVMWRTLDEQDGIVHYGLDDTTASQVSQDGTSMIHQIVVEGLEPGTQYSYKVQSGDTISAVHHLHTAPPLGSPVRFTVWGDNQNGPATFADVVALMGAKGPNFLVGVGDHVQEGSKPALWKEQLFDPARAILHEVPFYAAMGNHEQNAQDYYDLYAYPHLDEADPASESYYGYTMGNTYFLVVNTNTLPCPVGETDTPQSAYLKAAMSSPEAQAATWRIAYAHEPPYSESWSPGDCGYNGYLCLRTWLLPALAEHGFHAYFSGHAHVYERGQVDGVLQIITGGGGGALDEWCVDYETTSVVYQQHHFLTVDAGCDTLRVEATDLDGTLFDWVELGQDGTIVDQGPMADLPEVIVSSDSPTLQ